MKLSLVVPLLLVANLHVCALTFGQTVTLQKRNIKVEQLFNEVYRQTGYNVFYNESMIPVHARLDVSYDGESLAAVLKDVTAKYQLTYKIVDKNIILGKQRTATASAHMVREEIIQQRMVSGQVSDENGQPLAGVTITEVGYANGAITDGAGKFTITLQGTNTKLRFSFLGYETKEVSVSDNTTLNVHLAPAIQEMDNIVVVGYGTQKKENLTGATTVVDSKLLQSRPAANVSSLLQGTVPNLEVKFTSGRPGASGRFNIRGVNSISNNAAPLVIIDGFEGDINRINPNDVASITVLKDASAAAVYGARASYGVILVTTKTGSKNASSISYSGQMSVSAPTTSTDFETRGYYSAAINDLFFSHYAGTNYTTYTDDDYYQLWIRRNDKTENPERPWVVVDNRDGRDSYVYYGNTDWYNYLFNSKRPMQTHNININGSSDAISYSLSGNYFDQDGIFRRNTDNIKRYNLRSRVDFKVKDWLDINTNISYFNSAYAYPGIGGIENTFNSSVTHGLASIVPVNPDGTNVYTTTISNYSLMDGYSALLTQDLHKNLDKIGEFSPTIEAVIKPFEGFDVRASYRFIHYNYQTMNKSANIGYSKYPGEELSITSGIGNNRLYEIQTNHQYQAVNMYATYTKNLKDTHDIKLMGGYNYETKYLKDIKVARTGLLSDQLTDFEVATGDVMEINGGQNEYALFGVFYRANYGYKDKYLVEAAGRYDGTSRFAKGSRFGFFPSFSAAWRIDKEDFFQQLDQQLISGLKIRASYGSLGNQQVGYYDYLQTINAGGTLSYSFGEGTVGSYATESAPNSSKLTWETVNTTNFGLDLELLNNRLSFTGDIYRRETLNMLTAGKAIPAYYGASIPKENASDLLTKGWEMSVNWKDNLGLAGKPLNYYFGVGLGDNTSKITRFDNPNRNLANFYEGQELGEIWGYEVNRFFLSDEEATNYDVDQKSVNSIINTSAIDQGLHAGDLKFEDLDDDKKISQGDNTVDNPGDRRIIGNSLPRYNFNIHLGGSWNNIDLAVFVQGVGRQHWYPGINAENFWGPYSRPYATFIPSDFLSRVWSEENPNAYLPRPRGYIALNDGNRSLGVANSMYLQNLMYARLKNITVGYTLPANISSKAGLSRVRLYFSGENMLTLTKLKSKYIDPEQASTENTYKDATSNAKIYPWAKTFMFGLDISL
ncbi:TonB-dependent receptor [Sphingobacterium sp. SGG-5]|uniref:SusC/RagA family TonB-linked outer membrane protein n=1 Tax=Sphingobacterium sp. SGG-5 TaxID=2710881 RepID=UPI0013EC8D6D|nr:TonB-dependent receptor [Sphingobacterium sp. SGG-5]NGM62077.1 TonB-dependent receptor [Sphingobacterium sp. SGG-5]